MDTLTNPARVLGLTGCLGDLDIINTPSMINSNWLFSNMFDSGWKFGSFLIFLLLILSFLLLILSFLLLLIQQVTILRAFTHEEYEMEEDLASEEAEEYLIGEDGEGST
jgi:hypothetical protein